MQEVTGKDWELRSVGLVEWKPVSWLFEHVMEHGSGAGGPGSCRLLLHFLSFALLLLHLL